MAYISQITLPSGTTYDIKDAEARTLIAALDGSTSFLGVTTTTLTDGATTNPITINSESVTAVTGSIVTYGSKEFVWNGSAWQEFGDLSALGDLAYKNSTTATYTPAGTINVSISHSSMPSYNTFEPVTDVGTMPLFSTSVANENLTISWTAGQEPTLGSSIRYIVTPGNWTVSQATFTGTEATITST